MTIPSESDDTRDNPPRWHLPALVGVILLIAAIVTLVLTGDLIAGRRMPASPASASDQPTFATAHADAAAAQAMSPAHGGLNPDGPPVQEISLAEALAHFNAGTAVFVDVRSGSAYSAGHIPGALTITSRDLEERLNNLPDGVVIIAYGDAERPESGRRGAQIFMELGYPPVMALEGGFQAWRDAGYPVER